MLLFLATVIDEVVALVDGELLFDVAAIVAVIVDVVVGVVVVVFAIDMFVCKQQKSTKQTKLQITYLCGRDRHCGGDVNNVVACWNESNASKRSIGSCFRTRYGNERIERLHAVVDERVQKA